VNSEVRPSPGDVAHRLAALYEKGFGGKARGRYRISMKHMRAMTGRRRVTTEVLREIGEELFELGFVLIDMETHFVVLAHRTFNSYRRVSDACLQQLSESETEPSLAAE